MKLRVAKKIYLGSPTQYGYSWYQIETAADTISRVLHKRKSRLLRSVESQFPLDMGAGK